MEKNIGIVTGVFPSTSETFILNQIISFINLGYDVHILSFSKSHTQKVHSKIKDYNLKNKTHYSLNQPKNIVKRLSVICTYILLNLGEINWQLILKLIIKNISNKNLYNLHLFYRYSLFLKSKNIDTFIVHFGTNAIKLIELKEMEIFSNNKVVVHFHGYDLELNDLELNRKRYKNLFEMVDLFVVNTPYLRDILYKTNPKLNNVATIPVGLSLPIQSSISDKEKYNKFTVVFCGRLINWKGPDILIRIADKLINELNLNINFKIIGYGTMINDLMSLINEKELNKHIELMGALTQEEVFRVYQKSHLFLLPGIHEPKTGRAETQGLVIQEAQYFKLPVLVSDAGGMKYGLIDGETGYILKQYDINGFAEKIKLLYDNEKLRTKMGISGKNFVKENYDIAILTDRLIKKIETNK